MLSLKGDLDKKTKGTPKSFKRSLDENTAILENLPNALQAVVMLISRTAWSGLCVRLVYKSRTIFWADFLVIKGRLIHE